jgi:DNA-binding MarR family transcriptional regulator
MPEAHFSGGDNAVGAMVLLVADALREATEEAAGVSGALPAALVALHEFAGGKPIEYLAGALKVTHSRAVRVVDRLEAEGLARRRRATSDGRAVEVALTPAGQRRASAVAQARATTLTAFLDALTPSERADLGELAASVLTGTAKTRLQARRICRLCDVGACGHHEGRCPVTNAVDAAEARA